jgi:hypothetical protein
MQASGRAREPLRDARRCRAGHAGIQELATAGESWRDRVSISSHIAKGWHRPTGELLGGGEQLDAATPVPFDHGARQVEHRPSIHALTSNGFRRRARLNRRPRLRLGVDLGMSRGADRLDDRVVDDLFEGCSGRRVRADVHDCNGDVVLLRGHGH